MGMIGHGGHRFYAEDAWPVMLERIGNVHAINQSLKDGEK